ncbi:unnamed protein product [Adineta ricciae]|uniref:Uncharacterized protein n=1 Tax=Adineta ricciae TaxID=249248 RepID=A0A813SG99_ADIRI|nr:unnamed protein product [Adineta ricciae]CAF1233327.1 unnamed protein product [Adineta ricciae]
MSYMLGSTNHVIQREINETLEKNNYQSVIYFLFVMETLHTDELVIGIHIACQTVNNCAAKYAEEFIAFYDNQVSPVEQLKSLIFDSRAPSILVCYNSYTKIIEECSVSQRSTCIFNSTDILNQRCSSDLFPRLEYGFVIMSKDTKSIKKTYESIVCNTTACNDELVVAQIKAIVYHYTLFGMNLTYNYSRTLKYELSEYIYVLIFIVTMGRLTTYEL